MLLLEVKHLSCSVEGGSHAAVRRPKKKVLRDISFALDRGSTLALLGGSGSGKSTLACCLAGLRDPDGGSIAYEGLNIFPHTYNRASTGLSVQMLFQASGNSLNPLRSGLDALMEAIDAAGKKRTANGQHEVAKQLASDVGLPFDLLYRKPHQLSGGQRQRVAIARVLAAGPTLLILDEPTSALDTITQARVASLLLRLQRERGFSMVLITHDVSLALAASARIAVLHEGTIVEDRSSEEIRSRPDHPYTRQLLKDCKIIPEGDSHPG